MGTVRPWQILGALSLLLLASSVESDDGDDPIIVTTILDAPFVTYGQGSTGNDRFEGYLVDLMEEIASNMNIKYELKLVKDGRYGAIQPNGTWNGMIGEVLDKRADMALAPLVITYLRSQVVDFSHPYMSGGLGILMKRPLRTPEAEAQSRRPVTLLMAPFTVGVWMSLLVSFVLVSVVLFLFIRCLPSNKQTAEVDARAEQTVPSCLDGFWLAGRSLLFQGFSTSRVPTSIPMRILAFFWFSFVLVSVLLYLVALFSIFPGYRASSEPPLAPVRMINSAVDLAAQQKVKYGTVAGGASSEFFKTSKIDIYERMWQAMSSAKPSAFVNSVDDGIRRVREGNYAFIGESMYLDYHAGRNCDVERVGSLLSSTGYGLAFPRNSPILNDVNAVILRLRESGTLQKLHNKWWVEKRLCPRSEEPVAVRQSNAGQVRQTEADSVVDVAMFSGPLVLITVGLLLAAMAAAVELIMGRKRSGTDNQAASEEGKL